jgi:hypothetical protein
MAEPIYELVIGLMTRQYTCILEVPELLAIRKLKSMSTWPKFQGTSP